MKKIKKITIIIAALALLVVFTPIKSFAVSGTLKATAQKVASASATVKIENLKSRATHEIDRRLTALNLVLTRISTFKHITASDKAPLTSSVKTEISSLKSLEAKIQADTDLATLRADIKSIVDSYRIFLLFIPKIHLLAASDRMINIADELSSLSVKLQSKIQSAKAAGKDVTSLEELLDDITSKLADAKSLASNVQLTIIPLSPDGYPGNRSTLLAGRDMLRTGHNDLIEAAHDAQKIIQGLKSLKAPSSTSSATH
jgi:hypothetical protein